MKITFFLALSMFISCSKTVENSSSEKIIVAYNNQKLFASELAKILPKNATKKDSMTIAEAYIKSWLQKKITVAEASKNISAKENQDLKLQIEEYKEDLMLNKFYNQKLEKLSENEISDQEVDNYYTQNQKDFVLNVNIVQVHYLIADMAAKEEITQLQKNELALQEFAKNNLTSESYWGEDWFTYSQVKSQFQLAQEFQNIHPNMTLQEEKNNKVYLIKFLQTKKQAEIGPVKYFKNTIKSILINKRKLNLQTQLEDSLYEQAIQNNKITYYE